MSRPILTEQERRVASKARDELYGLYIAVRDHAPQKARSLDNIIARLEQWMGR